MPLDYRIILNAPAPKMGGTLAAIQHYGQMADQDRAQQREREADAILQQTLQQYADDPDQGVVALRRKGYATQAMKWEQHLTEQRKAKIAEGLSLLDMQLKAGQISKQQYDLQEAIAKSADPKDVLPFIVNAETPEAYAEGWALAKLKHGKKADAVLAVLPPPDQWTPDVSKRLARMLMTPDQIADNARVGAGGQGSDYAAYLARHAQSLNKKPEELTAAEELAARTAFYGAQRTEGGGTDFGAFLDDYLQGEAAKLGKTPQELGPSWKAGQTIKARKLYADADNAPQSGPSKTLSATAESNIINRLSNQWIAATKSAGELDRAVSLMDQGMAAARRGDMAQGAQAVLVTFQKILDPTSVVRESEYARSSAGLALMDRIQGAYERLAQGGAGVPIGELEKFAKLAKDMAAAQRSSETLKNMRERIGKTADRYNIPRELVTDQAGSAPTTPTAPTLKLTPPPNPKKDQTWTMPNGQTAIWDGTAWVVK